MFIELSLLLLVQVTEVVDGDTLKSNNDKIRLTQVDCPELAQPFGKEAKDFTSCKVLNKVVVMDLKKFRDKYGRLLGAVVFETGTLNEELVKEGLAWAYKSKKMSKLEAEARKEQKGLWSDPNAVAPWVYRKNK